MTNPSNKDNHEDGCKYCSRCDSRKPLSSFWKQSSRWDGLATWCRECSSRAQKIYNSKPEAQERIRKHHRGEKFRRYQNEFKQRPQEKDKTRLRTKEEVLVGKRKESCKKDREKYPERYAARNAVTRAVRHGSLAPAASCECAQVDDGKCAGRMEYHHHKGYEEENWLDVVPVCKYHHGMERRIFK